MSNIGGTYDLADQLPSNREFGHFFGRKSVSSPLKCSSAGATKM